ncbi:MAG: hypothetical protein ACE37H_11385 [Phycisphaeraceae bacterium]
MVSAKATVQKVLDNLPDDCTMQQVLDRLALVSMLEQRLDEHNDPNAESYSSDEVREMIAKWRVT